MKKGLLLTITTFAIALFANAQINKGSVLLGGGISIGKGTAATGTTGAPDNYNNNQHTTSIYPTVGIAIKQNTITGVNLSYA